MLRNPAQAAKLLCDLAESALPALTESAIAGHVAEAAIAMPLTRLRGPRAEMEPLLSRALDLTSAMTIVALKGGPYTKGWQVDAAESRQGAFAMTLFGFPDGKELALALLLWKGGDGLLHAGVNPDVAKAALSPLPKASGCAGLLLFGAGLAIAALAAGIAAGRS